MSTPGPETPEDLERFRQRARTWIGQHLRRLEPGEPLGFFKTGLSEEEELADVAHSRQLQRALFDAGLAGICFPQEYGGQGLSPSHQRVLNEELVGYEYPARLQVPNFSPCAAVILEFGNEEQKHRHIPAILRGDEIWMQFLSEPSGGSDVAAALTTAIRDGDEWVLNGSKIWTTGAWWSDWGLCLARTNWDVPKHRGLTVFMLPIHHEGVEVQRIEMLNGSREFCQEFLTDVRVPDADRIGQVDDGWTVGTRWMFHERMLYNSPLVSAPPGQAQPGGDPGALVKLARRSGRLEDSRARDLIGEARMLDLVRQALLARISEGVRSKAMSDQAAAIGRVFSGASASRRHTIAFELAGGAGAAWSDDEYGTAAPGVSFLMRQTSCIAGGTTEMARNVISERVLGMPRERTADRDVAFRDVPRSSPGRA